MERQRKEHRVYRRLCGGLTENYHTPSDLRVHHGWEIDVLPAQTLAVPIERKPTDLKGGAQDG